LKKFNTNQTEKKNNKQPICQKFFKEDIDAQVEQAFLNLAHLPIEEQLVTMQLHMLNYTSTLNSKMRNDRYIEENHVCA